MWEAKAALASADRAVQGLMGIADLMDSDPQHRRVAAALRSEPKTGGRKAADPRDRELDRLRRDKAQLEQRLQTAEDLIDLQKKLSGLLDRARNENER